MFDLPAPQDPHPPIGRSRHPYFMHDMIRRQSVAVHATCRATLETLREKPVAPPARRLLFVGLGTSFHAALAAADDAGRRFFGRWEVFARTSFDLIEDPSVVGPETLAVVFSASGDTALTLHAQKLLAERGSPNLLISAHDGSPSAEIAMRTILTRYADETSWTHTASYSSALVAAQILFESWEGDVPNADGREDEFADAVNQSLALENPMVEVADDFTSQKQFVVLGSGAAEPAAREGALKLREATGRFSTSVGVEEFLHGVIPSINDRTAVVALAATPLQRARALQGLAAAREVGAKTLLVDASGGAAEHGVLAIPPAPRPFPAVRLAIPVQLLAYWMAVSEGHNPDVMGLDDARTLAARRSFGI